MNPVDMTLADLIGQVVMLAFILLAVANRHLLPDLTDGNVERLEREAQRAEEARWWLQELEASR